MRPSPENETGLDPPNMSVDRTFDSKSSRESCRESFLLELVSVAAPEAVQNVIRASIRKIVNRFDKIVIPGILLWINKNRGFSKIIEKAVFQRSLLVDNGIKKFDNAL